MRRFLIMAKEMKLIEVSERLFNLFKGRKNAYGVYKIKNEEDKSINDNYNGSGKKQKGSAYTINSPLTIDIWKKHIKGIQGLGVIPIDEDNYCHWGAIDIDRYDIDIKNFCKKIENSGLIPCRTKSGGLHLYVFMSRKVKASVMRQSLSKAAKKIGFGGSEIFPKQTRVLSEQGDFGNWLNMPYFNALETNRFCILKGDKLKLSEFIEYAEKSKINKEELKNIDERIEEFETNEYFVKGPPCLNYLATFGFPEGSRNNALFNIGIFYKKSVPENWIEKINKTNNELVTPKLSQVEIDNIIKSLEKKEYNYRCNEIPICDHCDRTKCVNKKFGVGIDDRIEFPNLKSLTKIESEPPVYFLSINDQRIGPIESECLLNQSYFKKLCLEYLALIPPQLKSNDWVKVIQSLLDTQVIVKVPDEAKPKFELIALLDEFCTGRLNTEEKEELLIGRVYYNEQESLYYFRLTDFMEFLSRKRWFKLKQNEIIGNFNEFKINRKRVRIQERRFNVFLYNPKDSVKRIEPIKIKENPY